MPARSGETNRKWFERVGAKDGILLLGGSSLADFRVRVAQSQLRGDMLPSFWSLCGILVEGELFASVPLDTGDVSAVPATNGVRICRLSDYDDPGLFPNIAVVEFAGKHDTAHADINRVSGQRGIIDLPSLMLPWLGFVWGATGAANPLLNANGLPSAAFVETVFAMSGFELTPGLSSACSCPEAIWQSAKWWTPFFEDAVRDTGLDHAVPIVPQGWFAIRQPSAAVGVEPRALKELSP
ncbi:MAG TPA: hypothetical protein VK943_12595 [Arenibaculum sp.]|nr:hypothetical protein [Arenibaculum sp.]